MDEVTSRQAFPQPANESKGGKWYRSNKGLKDDRSKRKKREKF